MDKSRSRARFADLENRILKREQAGYPVEIALEGEQQFAQGYRATMYTRRMDAVPRCTLIDRYGRCQALISALTS